MCIKVFFSYMLYWILPSPFFFTIVYDDYKFVTRMELESLGLGHLIGTNLLRSVMHGFFVDIRLYHKVRRDYYQAMSNRKRKKILIKLCHFRLGSYMLISIAGIFVMFLIIIQLHFCIIIQKCT